MQHTLGSQQRKRRHSHVIVAEYQRHLPENAIAVSPPLQMPHACSGLRKGPICTGTMAGPRPPRAAKVLR